MHSYSPVNRHQEEATWGHSDEAAGYKPGRGSPEMEFSGILILTSGLQNCEQINLCCWGHLAFCGIFVIAALSS